MPGGRPTSYLPEYCDTAREVLALGHSVVGLAGKIGVSKSTIYEWMDAHPEFSAAVKEGQAGASAWWEERLMKIAQGEDGNATAAIFGLKNRAADEWRDKATTVHEDPDGKAPGVSAVETLAALLDKLAPEPR